MHSCIYEGQVVHQRHSPVDHAFSYRLYMVYLDLSELPDLVPQRRFGAATFLHSDHLAQSDKPIDSAVRDLVEQHTGLRPRGPIRLLTQLRYFGYYFSPLNLQYCFDEDGSIVESIVAEVSNTPWGEQHCYVLWEGNRTDTTGGLHFSHEKSFHVSPFMDMDVFYNWRLSTPGSNLLAHIDNHRGDEPFFTASLALKRQTFNQRSLNRLLMRYPLMTARITAAIYYQALKLWWKKCPYYPHPKKSEILQTR